MASPRTDLYDLVKANAPAKANVYSHPAEVVKLPAYIVQNGDPMLELDTMGGSRFQWNLEVIYAVTRSTPERAVTDAEDAARAVFGWLTGSGFWFQEASTPSPAEFAGVDAVAVTMTVLAKLAP